MPRAPSERPKIYTGAKDKSKTKYITPVEIVDSWDSAIAKAKRKITRLKEAICTFQEMKDSGESWPGSARQAHSHFRDSATQC
jgi:hypothetical protein